MTSRAGRQPVRRADAAWDVRVDAAGDCRIPRSLLGPSGGVGVRARDRSDVRVAAGVVRVSHVVTDRLHSGVVGRCNVAAVLGPQRSGTGSALKVLAAGRQAVD